jgi:hypothetical protein
MGMTVSQGDALVFTMGRGAKNCIKISELNDTRANGTVVNGMGLENPLRVTGTSA